MTAAPIIRRNSLKIIAVVSAVIFAAGLTSNGRLAAAECVALSNSPGAVTSTFTVPTGGGTYRVWSRIMASDATNNSYFLEIDDTTCGVIVGDSTSIAAGQWIWTDYKSGTATSKINVTLAAGTHTIKMAGREAGVKLDRVILAQDTNCIPTGTGDNCATLSTDDSVIPTIAITSPAEGETIGGTVNLVANAKDNTGVTKVEFYRGTTLLGPVSRTSGKSLDGTWTYVWDTSGLDGPRGLIAKAYDNAGNVDTSTKVDVVVSNVLIVKPGDVNDDGIVNGLDLSLVLSNYGRTGVRGPKAT